MTVTLLADTTTDIPKLYTALAEWLSCLLYARIILRGWPKGKRIVVLVAGLALLCPLQMFIGIVNIWWWLPCMALALLIMFVTLKLTCQTPVAETIYWLARSFTLAELAASLEWQLYTFFAHRYSIFRLLPVSLVFLFVIYAVVFVAAFLLEPRHGETHLDIDGRQLWIVITIAALTFALSNLSYISLQTPFSAEVGPQSFNIRTLVEIGGFAFLYAYHWQLCEAHTQRELNGIRDVLSTQYRQYQNSKDSIEIINRKYHDLKQQISVLRAEPSETKREHYLDDIEHDLADYGATNKTGNPTLDTVLTSKSLYCAHHHIELTCVAQGEVLDKVGISEMDIAAMFGNALDNAIEYCETLDDPGQRLIRVVVRQVRGFAFIAVENKIASADAARLQTRNGLPRSTKGDDRYHGFGLKSIQSLTRQYGGELSVKAENDWFKVHITIPIPASQKQR